MNKLKFSNGDETEMDDTTTGIDDNRNKDHQDTDSALVYSKTQEQKYYGHQ